MSTPEIEKIRAQLRKLAAGTFGPNVGQGSLPAADPGSPSARLEDLRARADVGNSSRAGGRFGLVKRVILRVNRVFIRPQEDVNRELIDIVRDLAERVERLERSK